ncbi:MAG TPA: carbamoyltransferase HypF [Nitrospirae bacterium]|nr:carbamoyltransferase HypF [bacterium BMS3Abin06]HDH13400.1 carbamoyltransferase HypF [Nitrospirota bacterium]HDZ02185.1 carbamoyltransferase HypF [Nitrospirota bacterium]
MRLKLQITGIVQGVGFRPFVFRLAKTAGLKGYVLNDPDGVLIEVEGEKKKLDEFLIRIDKEKPEIAKIYSLQHTFIEEAGYKEFRIKKSVEQGDKRAVVLPDISVCEECLADITNPKDRRFIYPFTNCTNCGPRFTIIKSLPYDRKNTSMRDFRVCPECDREYHSASDRRFHAQPNACHVCGPWISLYDSGGNVICTKEDALEKTVNLLRKGNIIAVKGIGGYHLACDAANEEAVKRLRKKKDREEKPMAVMFPDINYIKAETLINDLEERAISSIEKPIVIVRKRETFSLARSVSPDKSTVGVFLPCTPLHYLILHKLKKPVVATSANISGEPVVKDEKDAFARLPDIADYVLAYNREIVRRCDDSVVRVIAERQTPVRRSRGFAPLPVIIPFSFKKPVLALGPDMNNTIAVGIDNKVFLSQHIGDLDTPLAMEFYEETINDFLELFDIDPGIVVSDMHPGYYSTKFGVRHFSDKLVKVQHHFAHILSCMTENEVPEDTGVIGFAFDGTGYGPDKTLWGGEVLIASYKGFKRAYHLRPYRLPGGDKAVKEPCRTAFSLLYETIGDEAGENDYIPLTKEEKSFFIKMIKENINSPATTSMGRLFDGVASIIGLRHKVSYHAQTAMELEQLALRSDETGSYPFSIEQNIIGHRPVIEMIINDLKAKVPNEIIAKKFHNTIVKMIIFIAELLRKETGISHVALSGGVFQNSILLENAYRRLRERGYTPLIHQLVPTNDGGISLGQAVYSRFL